MKHITAIVISCFFLFSSCDPDEHPAAEPPVAIGFNEDGGFEIPDFIFPDSITAHDVVATFYDVHSATSGVIYLCDTIGKNAMVVKFLLDSTIVTDQLWAAKSDEFVSIKTEAKYIIRDRDIGYSPAEFNPATHNQQLAFLRTDLPK